jgi:membrane carboxypeptidase/penicillin-binding protein PbpC
VAILLYFVVAGAWAYRVTPTVLQHAQSSPVPRLAGLPPGAVAILLAVEDPSFHEHPGVDHTFAPGQGTVTLTRSLVHTLYLDGPTMSGVTGMLQRVYRAADRSVGPIDIGPDAMAIVLNRQVPKDRQIELFLAHVYMGAHGDEQLVGFEQAARRYHGKPLKDLTREEFVGLVAMIIGPNAYHPIRHRDRWAERVGRIERLLRRECRPQGVLDVYYDACATGVDTVETARRPSARHARSTASATSASRRTRTPAYPLDGDDRRTARL